MCQTVLYKDTKCKHRWMKITRPCFFGGGFSNCPSFSFNTHNRRPHPHGNNYYSPLPPVGNGLCHQPLCPYKGHPHANHTPSPSFPPSTQDQAQGQMIQPQGQLYHHGELYQVEGYNSCHVNMPGSPYYQTQHNCPYHQNLVAKPAPACYIARGEPCPECDLRGVYDRNLIRMVTKIKKGVKLGGGPSGGDPGVEVRCCVM
ncbi:hypothetical protein B0T20DRAFT_443522 [Sordaria brevicollis]|uniref:Uncharacterized protein n=1 Tax=Sordaria brevicollis TaxID=83679 RepID=A0AAE0U984_SORBR|nr:hypothetical protein B0T20DRAFT_443522 [Sordaria brevicollis]